MNRNIFKIRTHEPRNLSWWYKNRRKINMEPKFQRKSKVWSDDDKSFLINSVLNGYDIPKIYLADFSGFGSIIQEGNFDFAVIDGKQRLSAFFEFLSDDLKLSSGFRIDAIPDKDLGGYNYSKLTNEFPDIAEILEIFHLSVVTVETNDEIKIRELFRRLNSGKPLRTSELRNAKHGIVADTVRRISEHEFFQKKISLNTERLQENSIATMLLMFEYYGKVIDTKKNNIDIFIDLADDAILDTLEKSYDIIIDDLDSLYETFYYKDPILNQQSLIIVYYLFMRQAKVYGEELREFFAMFKDMYKNRNKSGVLSTQQKSLLDAFAKAARNINDAGSIQNRVNILAALYEIWLRSRLFEPNLKKREQ